MSRCATDGQTLDEVCANEHAHLEVQKCLHDLYTTFEVVDESAHERQELLTAAHNKASQYDLALQNIAVWLPACEQKLGGFAAVATDHRSLKVQLEELKVRDPTPLFVDYIAILYYM